MQPDGARAYVVNTGDDNVSVIDTATNTTVGALIPVGDQPFRLAIAPIIITDVPTLSKWGLIALAGILGIVGFMVIRRRRATA